MKKNASHRLAPLALALPLLAHAGPAIDLKAALKAGLQQNQGTPAAAENGAKLAPGQSVDSTVVTPVLAGIKALDIGGVRIGMSADEAKQVLKKLNPSFHQENLPMIGDAVRGFVMTNDTRRMQVYPTGLDRFTLYVNEANNVFFVKRELLQLPPERQIVRTTFFNSLAEKFDVPGIDTRARKNHIAVYRWMHDMQGRQYFDNSDSSFNPCQAQGSYAGNYLGFQESPPPTCAATISAQAFSDSKNQELVNGYLITIAAPWLRHDAAAVRAGANAAARQRQAEQDKVRENKPQL
ncbi:hypothetical protein MJ904_22480 [Massilia sp. MB5]|uniref:hypothetical protein n=1 Tax=Massilia sp. MB5 TaxID=2919578 RepID=UPI001F0F3569|nr:hypothetical protein [Massilia sp. MB5]UMR29776.1 hypothetical protein MJ904_22480 [Massilia sp. MB5]